MSDEMRSTIDTATTDIINRVTELEDIIEAKDKDVKEKLTEISTGVEVLVEREQTDEDTPVEPRESLEEPLDTKREEMLLLSISDLLEANKRELTEILRQNTPQYVYITPKTAEAEEIPEYMEEPDESFDGPGETTLNVPALGRVQDDDKVEEDKSVWIFFITGICVGATGAWFLLSLIKRNTNRGIY